MKFFPAILLIFFAALLQSTAFARLAAWNISPNFVLIGIIYISLSSSRRTAIWSAVLAGLLFDLFSSSFFGIYLLSFAVIAEFFHLAKSFLFTKVNFFVILVAVFLGTIFYEIFFILLNKLLTLAGLQDLIFSFKSLLYLMPKEVLFNLAAVAVIFIIAKVFKKVFRK